jgi:hypothetical protein
VEAVYLLTKGTVALQFVRDLCYRGPLQLLHVAVVGTLGHVGQWTDGWAWSHAYGYVPPMHGHSHTPPSHTHIHTHSSLTAALSTPQPRTPHPRTPPHTHVPHPTPTHLHTHSIGWAHHLCLERRSSPTGQVGVCACGACIGVCTCTTDLLPWQCRRVPRHARSLLLHSHCVVPRAGDMIGMYEGMFATVHTFSGIAKTDCDVFLIAKHVRTENHV